MRRKDGLCKQNKWMELIREGSSSEELNKIRSEIVSLWSINMHGLPNMKRFNGNTRLLIIWCVFGRESSFWCVHKGARYIRREIKRKVSNQHANDRNQANSWNMWSDSSIHLTGCKQLIIFTKKSINLATVEGNTVCLLFAHQQLPRIIFVTFRSFWIKQILPFTFTSLFICLR